MSEDPGDRDPWAAGLDQWFQAMHAGRQRLDELRQQVRSTAQSAVGKADLRPILQALELLERRGSEREKADDELRRRLTRVEERVDALVAQTEQLVLALELVSAARKDA